MIHKKGKGDVHWSQQFYKLRHLTGWDKVKNGLKNKARTHTHTAQDFHKAISGPKYIHNHISPTEVYTMLIFYNSWCSSQASLCGKAKEKSTKKTFLSYSK